MRIKNLLFLSTAFLLAGFLSLAQETNSKWSAEVLIGPSFPVGKFGSKDYKDSSAALAKNGVGAAISLSYRISDKITIVLLAAGTRNKQDEEALKKQLTQRTPPSDRTEVTGES